MWRRCSIRSPLIDSNMLALTRWIADYYACSWGQALDAVVPAGVKKHAGTRIATFLMVPEEAREALAGRLDQSAADSQAGRRDGSSRPRRVADAGRRLPAWRNARRARFMPCASRGLVRPVRKRLPVGLAAASPPEADAEPLETDRRSSGSRRTQA